MNPPIDKTKISILAKKLTESIAKKIGVTFVTAAPTEDQEAEQEFIPRSKPQYKKIIKAITDKALNATTVQQGNIQEYKTALSDTAHERSRAAQRSRKHRRTDRRNVLPGIPEPEQGVPSNRRYKELNPSSKIKPVINDSYNDVRQVIESYDQLNIAKPSGYGTFMTAADMGIKIRAGFALHPSVEKEIEERKNDKLD